MVFIAIYFFTVVPSDCYVTERALWAQVVALAALIVAWSAVGSATRGISVAALSVCAVFSLGALSVLLNLLLDPQAIIDYSERYPDQRMHQWVGLLGPQVPLVVFLALIVPANVALFGGTLASVVLRRLRLGGTGRTLLQLDRDVRKAIALSGDAPALVRSVAWLRWRGWIWGIAAVIVLMLPLVLSGRELDIPASRGWRNFLPDLLARALAAGTDRFL